MSESFTKKIIRVTFVLGKGSFGAGNTKIINGSVDGVHLHVAAQTQKCGHPSKTMLKLKIFGMKQEDANLLTRTTTNANQVPKNYVLVEAGDKNGFSTVFKGEITGAWQVYKSPPNLYFHVEAMAGFYPSVQPAKPLSVKGGASVVGLMEMLAGQMGYTFENNGVTTQMLNNPYLDGTLYNQIAAVAEAAGIEFGIDDGIVWIAPNGKPRNQHLAPVISAETGMKESPTFDKKGVKVAALYNGQVQIGGQIFVKSTLVPAANGYWLVNGLSHQLECESPGGQWTSIITASPIGSHASFPVETEEGGGE